MAQYENLYRVKDGYKCPYCGTVRDTIDSLIGHVSQAHGIPLMAGTAKLEAAKRRHDWKQEQEAKEAKAAKAAKDNAFGEDLIDLSSVSGNDYGWGTYSDAATAADAASTHLLDTSPPAEQHRTIPELLAWAQAQPDEKIDEYLNNAPSLPVFPTVLEGTDAEAEKEAEAEAEEMVPASRLRALQALLGRVEGQLGAGEVEEAKAEIAGAKGALGL